MTLKQAIIIGLVFGLVAATVVWYLERFELNRLHGEMRAYLKNHQLFDDYLNKEGNNE